jgi:hypothetical protein
VANNNQQPNPSLNCDTVDPSKASLITAPDGSLQFRITPDQSVESQSLPSGIWKKEYSITPPSFREQAYLQKTRTGNIYFEKQPSSAVFDPKSRNLVLAMGQDGVLVRQVNGGWQAVAVGPYEPHSLESAGLGGVLVLLEGELLLAGIAALTVFSILSICGRRRKLDWLRLVFSLIFLVGAAGCAQALDSGNSEYQFVFIAGLFVAGLWATGWGGAVWRWLA